MGRISRTVGITLLTLGALTGIKDVIRRETIFNYHLSRSIDNGADPIKKARDLTAPEWNIFYEGAIFAMVTGGAYLLLPRDNKNKRDSDYKE